MNKYQIFIALIVLFTSGLVKADLSDSALVPKEEMSFAKDYLNKIRTRDFEYVLSYIDPELSDQVSIEKIEEVAQYFPSGKVFSTELIGSKVNTFNSTWQGNFSFEYNFEGGWAVANVAMRRVADTSTVIGFNVYRTEASQKELNKFVLSGKTVFHYLILVLACVIPIFIFITLIYCIKTPIPKRKWLWVLFVLGGIGTVSINWVSGEYGFKIVQYLLFGAAANAGSGYAPWVISAGFPLGAIIFWFKRKSFIEQSKTNKSMQPTPPALVD